MIAQHLHHVKQPQWWLLACTVVLLVTGAVHMSPKARAVVEVSTGSAARSMPTPQVAGNRERAARDLTLNCAQAQCIALTFDDGPNAKTTPQVLTILEQQHVPASFFIVGSHVAGNQALLRRMYADGDEIGDHSWSHADFTKLSVAQMHDQISRTQAAIHSAGVPYPTLFRPPYGAVNDTVRATVRMSFMFWNEDPKDWSTPKPDDIVKSIDAAAHPGGVVIMHDVHAETAAALPQVIQHLRANGYQFATPSQMLGIAPGESGDFYGRPPK